MHGAGRIGSGWIWRTDTGGKYPQRVVALRVDLVKPGLHRDGEPAGFGHTGIFPCQVGGQGLGLGAGHWVGIRR